MWVALAIGEQDIDFWIDDFRFFEGLPKDEKVTALPKSVSQMERVASFWGKIKSQ